VKTFHSALVAIPPEEAWGPVQRIRTRFDRHLRRWMPHLTLLYPFRPRAEFGAAEAIVREVCAPVAPFEVTLAEFRSFPHGPESHTLWLHPDPPEPFVRLQAALQAAFPDCDDASRYESGFTAHLSVGQARLPADLEARLRVAREGWTPIRWKVEELALIAREGEAPFEVDRRVALGQ
jgi:2'-5' RNA ligase